MAIFTKLSRYEKAKLWKDTISAGEGVWFGFGRTTPWADENNPPTPDPNATTVEEVVGYKKADAISFIKEDSAGSIQYLGRKYSMVEDGEAESNNLTLLYLRSTYDYGDLPEQTIRQIGIFYGLVRGSTGSTGEALTPDQVASPGELFVLDNTTPNSRVSYQRDEYAYVLQF